jgi:hypothetical protein
MSKLETLVQEMGFSLEYVYEGMYVDRESAPDAQFKGWEHYRYKVTLSRKPGLGQQYDRLTYTTTYKMGMAHTKGPTLADVVASLIMDTQAGAYTTFEDFASEMGYDNDSRKAEQIYQACRKTAIAINRMVTTAEYDALCAAVAEY